MDILQAIILGLVEGLTEFLPVSSTGHLIVVGQWLGLDRNGTQTAFDVIIQLAAILAVVANYSDKFRLSKLNLWMKIALAFLPIGVVGFLFSDQIEAMFSVPVVAIMFIVGGVVFLVLEFFYKEQAHHVARVEDVSWLQALGVGVAQVFALIPGTSRSGATIVGGLVAGMDRKTSAEFSFLLALPVMGASTGYEIVKHHQDFTGQNWLVLGVGFVTAFVVAYFTMKLFVSFLARFNFVPFAAYRIVFGLILFMWFMPS